jgi:hypothetical protein
MLLGGGNTFDALRHPQRVVTADATGHFTFRPELDMHFIAVASAAGFKMVSIDSLKTNGQITLEPWGTIKGTFYRNEQDAADETLYLSFAASFDGRGLSLFIQAITDENGAFEFDHVPPGECMILALNLAGNTPGPFDPMEKLRVEPGQVVKTTIDAPAKPVVHPTRIRQQQSNSTPSGVLKGFVLLPDGKQAVEAAVGFTGGHEDLHIGDGEFVARKMSPNTTFTDGGGAFRVSWPDSPTALCVAAEQGVAKLDIAGLPTGCESFSSRGPNWKEPCA